MSQSVKCIAFLLLLSIILAVSKSDVTCPSAACFCDKKVAEKICSRSLLKGRCKVRPCSKSSCTKSGYSCQQVRGLLSKKTLKGFRRKVASKFGGCTANVCFAIDGSGSIKADEFQNEKDFVDETVYVIEVFNSRVAATQYSDKNYPISSLTSDFTTFNAAVQGATQVRRTTSISAGIDYCAAQLRNYPGEANKVVVLGDGLENVDQEGITAADNVRSDGGKVAVVAEGKADNPKLLAIAGNDFNLVFTTDDLTQPFSLGSKIESLITEICKN